MRRRARGRTDRDDSGHTPSVPTAGLGSPGPHPGKGRALVFAGRISWRSVSFVACGLEHLRKVMRVRPHEFGAGLLTPPEGRPKVSCNCVHDFPEML